MCGRLPEQVNTQHAGCLKKEKIQEKNTKYNKNKVSTSEQFHKVMLITTTIMQQ